MAPAFEPVEAVDVKATRARPLAGLIPTARGIKGKGPPETSAEGKVSSAVTWAVERFTTASVALPLLATRARLRRLSTATEIGAVAARVVHGSEPPSVQSAEGALGDAKFIILISPDPWLVTTANPVAVLIAT